jgi:hypothetical protein
MTTLVPPSGADRHGASMPLAATFLPRPPLAQEAMQGSGFAPWNRFKLGSFEVTTLLAGTRASDKPQETFGTNASPEDFATAFRRELHPGRHDAELLHPDRGEHRVRDRACSTPAFPPKAPLPR